MPNLYARPPRHRGFTLVEIMVVIVIVGFLVTLLIAGGGVWVKRSKVRQTLATLATLDAIIDEYHTETGHYFSDDIMTLGDFEPPDFLTPDFLNEVQGVGDIAKIIGGLRTPGSKELLDAWGNPLEFENPVKPANPVRDRRPWFWSWGPNAQNESEADYGNPVSGDDIRSAAGAL